MNTNYAILKNGGILQFRMKLKHIENLGIPADRYVQYKKTPKPLNTLINVVTEIEPIQVEGVWTQQWEEHVTSLDNVKVRIKKLVNDKVNKSISSKYSKEDMLEDIIGKEYSKSALLMIGNLQTSSDIYKTVGTKVNEIFALETTLTEAYQSFSAEEELFWKTLLVGGLKVAWVVRLKQEAYRIEKASESLETIQELQALYDTFTMLPWPIVRDIKIIEV